MSSFDCGRQLTPGPQPATSFDTEIYKEANSEIGMGSTTKLMARCLPSIAVRNKATVLVVDDDPLIILAVCGMLKKLNCEVYTAANGLAAVHEIIERNSVEKVASTPVQLVLMDANMPVMNGYDAATKIDKLAQEGKITPAHVACLSAQDSQEHIQLCHKAGMDYIGTVIEIIHGIVEKPCSLHALSETLKFYRLIGPAT